MLFIMYQQDILALLEPFMFFLWRCKQVLESESCFACPWGELLPCEQRFSCLAGVARARVFPGSLLRFRGEECSSCVHVLCMTLMPVGLVKCTSLRYEDISLLTKYHSGLLGDQKQWVESVLQWNLWETLSHGFRYDEASPCSVP